MWGKNNKIDWLVVASGWLTNFETTFTRTFYPENFPMNMAGHPQMAGGWVNPTSTTPESYPPRFHHLVVSQNWRYPIIPIMDVL